MIHIKDIFSLRIKIVYWPQFSVEHIDMESIATYANKIYFLSISDGIKNQLLKLGVPDENIFVIYNPIKRHKKHIQTKRTKIYYTYVGRIQYEEQKNIKFLLDGFRDRSNYQLNIIGDGTDIKKCQQYAKLHNINVTWFGWKDNPWKDLETDYIVLTSNYEGFGMVLVEAISRGIPVISSNCETGPREIVNESNGLLYQMNSMDSFQKILDESLIKKETWDAEKLQESISKYYMDKYITNFLSAIKTIWGR